MTLSPNDFERGVKLYWNEIRRRSPETQRREREFPEMAEVFKARRPAHFNRGELEVIMAWKHTDARWRERAIRGLGCVTDEEIHEVTNRIDSLERADDAYRALRGFARGVGVASISAILAAARPDRFPVLDVFALIAVLDKVPEPWHAQVRLDKQGRPQAHERIYPQFTETCRRLASWLQAETEEQKWTPRRVDMALWGIGKGLADRGWRG